MSDSEPTTPDEYQYQIIVSEDSECKCGSTHEEGHALWGGRKHPDDMAVDAFATVRGLHSVDVELVGVGE